MVIWSRRDVKLVQSIDESGYLALKILQQGEFISRARRRAYVVAWLESVAWPFSLKGELSPVSLVIRNLSLGHLT